MAELLTPIIPDPSDRASQQVLREITTLREIIETRLDASDEARAVAETRYLRIPAEIKEAVAGLENVMLEKFKGIDGRFSERDVRVIQSDIDAKLALKAALDSAEKAVVKAEVGMTKLTDGLAKRIDELRDSQKQTEGSKQAASEIKTETKTNYSLVIGMIGAAVALGGAVIAAIGVATAVMVAVVAWNHTTPPIAPVTYSQQPPAK